MCGVWGLGFGVFEVRGFGFSVSRFGVLWFRVSCSGFLVRFFADQGFGFGVQGLGFGFRVFEVRGFVLGVQGLGFGVQHFSRS